MTRYRPLRRLCGAMLALLVLGVALSLSPAPAPPGAPLLLALAMMAPVVREGASGPLVAAPGGGGPAFELSAFQRRVLELPESVDVVLAGGRGGGKDYAAAFLILRHLTQYGDRARCLYVRRTYAALGDVEQNFRAIFRAAFNGAASYNRQSHHWSFPTGGALELGQLTTDEDYAKYQGRSFSLLAVSECQHWPSPDLLDLLRSNLRSPVGVPARAAWLANPGGIGSHWFARRYVLRFEPWRLHHCEDNGTAFVLCPSTHLDNPHIDREAYAAKLRESAPSNPALVQAWLDGNWTAIVGNFFQVSDDAARLPDHPPEEWASWLVEQSELRESLRERTEREPESGYGALRRMLQPRLAHDWGSAAPSVTLLLGTASTDLELPDGRHVPKGTHLVLDEVATAQPGDLTKGLELSVPEVARRIVSMCDRWKVRPTGVADPAIFAAHGHAAGSIADEFADQGVRFTPALKVGRVNGWEKVKTKLKNATSPGDGPPLFISTRCKYLWNTLPFLSRDKRNPEDVDTTGPDHGADALRYALVSGIQTLRRSPNPFW